MFLSAAGARGADFGLAKLKRSSARVGWGRSREATPVISGRATGSGDVAPHDHGTATLDAAHRWRRRDRFCPMTEKHEQFTVVQRHHPADRFEVDLALRAEKAVVPHLLKAGGQDVL